MPNWSTTTYLFACNKKNVIEDFHSKLTKWLKEPSLYPKAFDGCSGWLGNILLHAGFGSPSDAENIAPCRYRGTLDEVSEKVEESILGGETLYFFHILVSSAWTEMPVMWQLIKNKLYPDKNIRFAFITELELSEYRATYNHELLSLIGIEEDERFWLDCYVEDSENASLNVLAGIETGETSAEALAKLFSEVLQRVISPSDITDSSNRDVLVLEINMLLTKESPQFYLTVFELQESRPENWQ